ncbi:MAG: SGNH/GDSL hydrolase family protein [Actinomycetota bacterium]|nr:SGNH/GDSL hydrolase family protein [Actinomycetota bacterium]
MGRFIRGSFVAVAFGALAGLGAEIAIALRRDYLKEGPPDRIQGDFGDEKGPRLDLVVIGDSFTVGVGTTPERSFPWLVAQRLGEDFRVRLNVLGMSGNNTSDVADSQLPLVLDLKPRLVLIEVGANDATHFIAPAKVREKMGRTLESLLSTGASVVVIGPPDMGAPRAWAQPLRALIGWSGRRVADAIRDEAIARAVPYFDLAAATGDEFAREPFRYFSWDLFHPSAGGYLLWVDAMFDTIKAAAMKTVEAAEVKPKRKGTARKG